MHLDLSVLPCQNEGYGLRQVANLIIIFSSSLRAHRTLPSKAHGTRGTLSSFAKLARGLQKGKVTTEVGSFAQWAGSRGHG